jgi:rod shape-determining protein MreB
MSNPAKNELFPVREEADSANGSSHRGKVVAVPPRLRATTSGESFDGERSSRATQPFLQRVSQFLMRDFAIDVGTANTLIYEKGRGIILNEPSVVAMRIENGRKKVVAFGTEAKRMLGRTPEGVKVIRPIRTGVIADFDAATLMLSHFLGEVRKRSRAVLKPRVLVGVPSGITEVEKRAIREAVESQARGSIRFIDEAMAAAIGCRLPVTEAAASMIVDIGGGTTDIAVLSLKDIVFALSVREGGDAIDEAIINYLRRTHHLLIGDSTAEEVKRSIGSAHESFDYQEMEVRGRSLVSGAPSALIITGREIREAIADVVTGIVAAVRQALENTPPELSGDILSRGLALAGGGALLHGLADHLRDRLGVKVSIAAEPLAAVVDGAGFCLDDEERFRSCWYEAGR